MHLPARFLPVVALLALPIQGCTEVTTPTTAPFALTVFSVDEAGGARVILVGAQLCETGTRNCAPSNEDGRASIPLPIAEETSVTLVKDGHASYLFPVFLRPFGDNWDGPFDMATDGYIWLDVISVLTSNSSPSGSP